MLISPKRLSLPGDSGILAEVGLVDDSPPNLNERLSSPSERSDLRETEDKDEVFDLKLLVVPAVLGDTDAMSRLGCFMSVLREGGSLILN
jgi:hypothetical protein